MIKNMPFLMLVLVFVLTGDVYSQDPLLNDFNETRNRINTLAMLTLGGWAASNIAVSTPLYFTTDDERQKYFYQMNTAWNVINLGIAGLGYCGAVTADTSISLFQSIEEQANIENILLFNAGLDVAYMMTGFYLIERSKSASKHKYRLKGYGQSIILQGSFLFLFDAVVFYMQQQNTKLLEKVLTHAYVSPNGVGVQFYF
ncbi:MAG: hypothetical protein GF313_05105 [Caldithrix sp.]|nr:hypothetical protein [Caldithrix sp.]